MSLDPATLMSYWPLLIGVARRRLPGAGYSVWEDIAGDTVERALRYQDRCRNPHGWLTVMADRIALGHRRRKVNMPMLSLDESRKGTLDAGGERHVAIIDLRGALQRVKPQDRSALTDYYRDGVTTDRCADRQRRCRALVRVRAILEGQKP